MMSSLGGLRIVVAQHMAFMKKAVKVGDTVYVSPAMYDLIEHASPEELEHLLRHIGLIDLGKGFDPLGPLPLTVEVPR